jgi:hypothetical protein
LTVEDTVPVAGKIVRPAVCHDMLQFSARVLAILANLDW